MLALATALIGGAAWAATVYRWTDEHGVVHFADVPPPNVETYSRERLPDAPPAPTRPPAPADSGAPAHAAKAPAAPVPKGPARVVIAAHEEVGVGDAVQSFTGKVRNEGGTDARNVSISVRVVEPSQGDECLREVIEVEPATLPPGATGTFEAEFDSPCFRWPTQADLRVRLD